MTELDWRRLNRANWDGYAWPDKPWLPLFFSLRASRPL